MSLRVLGAAQAPAGGLPRWGRGRAAAGAIRGGLGRPDRRAAGLDRLTFQTSPLQFRAMQSTVKPLDRNHLSLLVAVTLLGNVLFRFIELPEAAWQVEALGSALRVHFTGKWLLVALMVALVSTGTNFVIHDHPAMGRHRERPAYVSWILPAAMAGLSAYLLSLASTRQLWIVGLALVGALVSMAVTAEYGAVTPEAPGYALARLALNVLAYVLAFAFLTLIYRSRARSLLSATGVVLITSLLSLDLLTGTDIPFRRALLFSFIIGLILGECTWALNYWRISAWAGGLFLLLVFYGITNVAHQHLLERLNAATVIEFAAVIVAVMIIVLLRAR